MKKVLFLVADDFYFYTHRLNLALAAKSAGYDVLVATRLDTYRDELSVSGLRFYELRFFHRSSLHPWTLWRSLRELIQLYRIERPDVVHLVALKPVLLGSIAAFLTRVPRVVAALGGLGFLKSAKHGLHRMIKQSVLFAYRILLNRPNTVVIVQTDQDRLFLESEAKIRPSRICLIRGAGVDINYFQPIPEAKEGPVQVILAARLLWSKGVGEFVEAASYFQKEREGICFHIYGVPDGENKNSVPETLLQEWHDKGLLQWHARVKDMRSAFQHAHIVALPTYYPEGVPKILLEAAASAKAIVCTGQEGCLSVVTHRETGLIVPERDAGALIEAISLLAKDAKLRQILGSAARKRIEKDFDQIKIIEDTLKLY